ncbi:MAG: LuxR family transcriptional regulator [Hyphomonadaceae bacterium JAD_PAG50586_4]|nr:MAG: LuxR family transcriptional regulator [Hyphomonadaceae bacterium JAD_PAG50586_4]
MNPAPLINDAMLAYAQACEDAASLADLELIWRARMRELGFAFAALGGHVDPLHPDRTTYVFCDYPGEWLAHFSTQRYHLIDPVYRAVEAGWSDFLWNDPDFSDALPWRQRRILAEARECGLRFGRTHALAPTLYLAASSSLVSECLDVDPAAYATAKLVNVITHHRAALLCAPQRPEIPELRPRERQCLELCAHGRTDAEIARELAISIATVRRHIESARARFGVSSRLQAALRAQLSGQIEP